MPMQSPPLPKRELSSVLAPEDEIMITTGFHERGQELDAMTVVAARGMNARLERERRRLMRVVEEIDRTRNQINRATGSSA